MFSLTHADSMLGCLPRCYWALFGEDSCTSFDAMLLLLCMCCARVWHQPAAALNPACWCHASAGHMLQLFVLTDRPLLWWVVSCKCWLLCGMMGLRRNSTSSLQ
jgi:hypothetical protein